MEWLTKLPEPVLWGCLALLAILLWGVITGKIKFRKNKDGSFQLGDDTPFEKTNARFKQLCHDIHDVKDVVPTVNHMEQIVKQMEQNVTLLKSTVEKFTVQNEDTQMFILRSTVANEQLPDDERMHAYDEYKRRGGNSWVDAYWSEQLPMIQERIKARLGSV
jgi:hypothetical protein